MVPHAHATQAPDVAPADAFRRLAHQPGVSWLDSSRIHPSDGRFSILACQPRWVLRIRGAGWRIQHADGTTEAGTGAPLAQLDHRLAAAAVRPPATTPHLPFYGGAIGWLSYDLGRQFENVAGTAVGDLPVPDLHLAWYDAAIVWDHTTGETWLVAIDGVQSAAENISRLQQALARIPTGSASSQAPRVGPAQSDFSRDAYLRGVRATREAIARGEFYQLNLVQRLACPHQEPAALTYLRLRELNPAPFGAYLSAEDFTVLCSSPERFLEITPEGDIRTCPIKGTRPRGATAAEDARLQAELLASPKERAELLMIVDLLRNDLGRVCATGSVTVERLHAIESFATVHHLVGEVRGRLRPDVTPAGLLRALFPGGSITGAPKISAMQTIDRLEPHRRGIGMGAIGYFSAHGRVDLAIAIRTIISHHGVAYVPVGAGIVWDSDPAAEYEETLAKARASLAALGADPPADSPMPRAVAAPAASEPLPMPADGVFETILLRAGRLEFWGEHWHRFAAGCRWFGFDAPITEAAARAEVRHQVHTRGLQQGTIRIAAWRDVNGTIVSRLEVGPPRPHLSRPEFSVQLGPMLPPPSPDRAFKHLRREAWLDALHRARAAGFDEVLLHGPDGDLVEGAVTNVFVVYRDELLTPPLTAGPLPGVMRAQVIDLARRLRQPVHETRIGPAEIAGATEIWLTNSLLGLRPVSHVDASPLPAAHPQLDALRAAWQRVHGWDPIVTA